MLFFADRAEGAVTQGMLMGSVTVVITLLLLLLVFFDHPHGHGVGRLQPTAMERTLRPDRRPGRRRRALRDSPV